MVATELVGGVVVLGAAVVVCAGRVAGGRVAGVRVGAGCVVGEGMVVPGGVVGAAAPGGEQHHDDHHHDDDQGDYSSRDPLAGAAFSGDGSGPSRPRRPRTVLPSASRPDPGTSRWAEQVPVVAAGIQAAPGWSRLSRPNTVPSTGHRQGPGTSQVLAVRPRHRPLAILMWPQPGDRVIRLSTPWRGIGSPDANIRSWRGRVVAGSGGGELGWWPARVVAGSGGAGSGGGRLRWWTPVRRRRRQREAPPCSRRETSCQDSGLAARRPAARPLEAARR